MTRGRALAITLVLGIGQALLFISFILAYLVAALGAAAERMGRV